MKHLLTVALIFGWFFGITSPWEGNGSNGVVLVQLVGPFQSEAACKAAFAETEAFIRSIGAPAQFSKCRFTKEA